MEASRRRRRKKGGGIYSFRSLWIAVNSFYERIAPDTNPLRYWEPVKGAVGRKNWNAIGGPLTGSERLGLLEEKTPRSEKTMGGRGDAFKA